MWKNQALGFIKFTLMMNRSKNYFYDHCLNSDKQSQGHIIGINSRIIPPASEVAVGVHDEREGRSRRTVEGQSSDSVLACNELSADLIDQIHGFTPLICQCSLVPNI